MTFSRIGFLCLFGLARVALAQDGPSHAIVTYRVTPDKHVAFRAGMVGTASRMAQWKDGGGIGGFTLLTNALIDDEGWESTAIVQLGARGLEQLKRLDSPDAASLLSTTTVPADLIDSGSGEGETAGGVYLVIPYESTGNPDDCKDYVMHYLSPLLKASLKEGSLVGYQLFWARFPAGRSWSALAVMHYRDWAALGQRDAVTAKVGADFAAPNRRGAWRERVAVIAEASGVR